MKNRIWNRLSSLQVLRSRELEFRAANPLRIQWSNTASDRTSHLRQSLIYLIADLYDESKQTVEEYKQWFEAFEREDSDLFAQILPQALIIHEERAAFDSASQDEEIETVNEQDTQDTQENKETN